MLRKALKENKMKLLLNKQQETFEKAKMCYIRGEDFEDKNFNNK